MKICCLVKFVPDVNNFKYDYENNTIIRNNVSTIINPDDRTALAYAIKLKENNPNISIEIVSMGPISIKKHIQDYLRMNVDNATIISDQKYVGSDSWVTSRILYRYLNIQNYDLILCGTHSLDGDTSHVPNQIAQLLQYDYLGNIKRINEFDLVDKKISFEIESDDYIDEYVASLPVMLGFSKASKYKMPFVKFDDLKKNVDEQIKIIDNNTLNFESNEIGLDGSPTKVIKTYVKQLEAKTQIFVDTSDEGIDTVYQFLKAKEFIK